GHAGTLLACNEPLAVPRTGAYAPPGQVVDFDGLLAGLPAGWPVVPVIFYRSMLLASDVAPIDALCQALVARDLAPAPLFVASLKDDESASFLLAALPRLAPAAIITTTAFAAGGEAGGRTPLDACGVPVLQAVVATTKR